MRTRILLYLLLSISGFAVQGKTHYNTFDKSAFYMVMASSNIEEVDAQLSYLRGSTFAEKEAYEGALLMKKAGMVSKPIEKFNLFKSGRSKLEFSISKDKDNPEFRFLRLIIQEHAPRIVNYRNEVGKDSQLIRTNYKNLTPVVQQAIIDYSKKSRALKPSYF